MTAAEAYEAVTHGGASDFAEVVALLSVSGTWCLIGGLAVNCYVEPVYTLDADIVVVADALPKLTTALRDRGFQVKEFPNSLNARRGDSQLNIQFTTDPQYQDFLRGEMKIFPVLGELVPVASLEDLIRGKVWAWSDTSRRASKRKKDELDLLRIAESHLEVRRLIPESVLEQLAK